MVALHQVVELEIIVQPRALSIVCDHCPEQQITSRRGLRPTVPSQKYPTIPFGRAVPFAKKKKKLTPRAEAKQLLGQQDRHLQVHSKRWPKETLEAAVGRRTWQRPRSLITVTKRLAASRVLGNSGRPTAVHPRTCRGLESSRSRRVGKDRTKGLPKTGWQSAGRCEPPSTPGSPSLLRWRLGSAAAPRPNCWSARAGLREAGQVEAGKSRPHIKTPTWCMCMCVCCVYVLRGVL